MSLNLEERLEAILKTEISSSLYCVNNELGTLFLDIRLFKSESLLLVYDFKEQTDYESCNA